MNFVFPPLALRKVSPRKRRLSLPIRRQRELGSSAKPASALIVAAAGDG